MFFSHDLYKTGDPDVPDALTDDHGDVVLQQCRWCKQGEADLTEECPAAHLGPLPVWATKFNLDCEITIGTQLLTRDGRRTGNARITEKIGDSFKVVTDANNTFTLTVSEIFELFTIGDYLVSTDPKSWNTYDGI